MEALQYLEDSIVSAGDKDLIGLLILTFDQNSIEVNKFNLTELPCNPGNKMVPPLRKLSVQRGKVGFFSNGQEKKMLKNLEVKSYKRKATSAERFFTRSPFSIVTMAVRTKGYVSADILRIAVDKAQQRHALLRVRIVDDVDHQNLVIALIRVTYATFSESLMTLKNRQQYLYNGAFLLLLTMLWNIIFDEYLPERYSLENF